MAILPITSWRKQVYVAHLSTISNVNGNQTKNYAIPVAYTMNIQPLSDNARIDSFGANAKKMYRALINSAETIIKEFDVAYLESASPSGETVNGQNANFIVRRVAKQNTVTIIYFESMKSP